MYLYYSNQPSCIGVEATPTLPTVFKYTLFIIWKKYLSELCGTYTKYQPMVMNVGKKDFVMHLRTTYWTELWLPKLRCSKELWMAFLYSKGFWGQGSL